MLASIVTHFYYSRPRGIFSQRHVRFLWNSVGEKVRNTLRHTREDVGEKQVPFSAGVFLVWTQLEKKEREEEKERRKKEKKKGRRKKGKKIIVLVPILSRAVAA